MRRSYTVLVVFAGTVAVYLACFVLNVFPNAYAMLVSLPAVPLVPLATYIVWGKAREIRTKSNNGNAQNGEHREEDAEAGKAAGGDKADKLDPIPTIEEEAVAMVDEVGAAAAADNDVPKKADVYVVGTAPLAAYDGGDAEDEADTPQPGCGELIFGVSHISQRGSSPAADAGSEMLDGVADVGRRMKRRDTEIEGEEEQRSEAQFRELTRDPSSFKRARFAKGTLGVPGAAAIAGGGDPSPTSDQGAAAAAADPSANLHRISSRRYSCPQDIYAYTPKKPRGGGERGQHKDGGGDGHAAGHHHGDSVKDRHRRERERRRASDHSHHKSGTSKVKYKGGGAGGGIGRRRR